MRSAERLPTDYSRARTEFLQAATEAGGRIESLQNPNVGPRGEALYTDSVQLGPADAHRALILSSGTHGVEGFIGSGIQTLLLREGLARRLPGGVNLLMIHAINPWGMAHLRRVNEDNVDLNRNFRNHAEIPPENPYYERLADVVAPRSLSISSEATCWSRLAWYRLTAGRAASQAAVSGGQYARPDGLFFGGTSETWSNRTYQTILRRYLSHATEVISVDVHTGLGAFAAVELILNSPEGSPEYERAVAIWGPALVKATVSGASVSAHLDASLKLAVTRTLPAAAVTAVSLEFGTVPPLAVFRALRAENWLHFNGGWNNPRAQRIKNRLLRSFHPDSERWEMLALAQGRAVVDRALASLGA